MQNQKEGHQKVEDVVDREHLDQLQRDEKNYLQVEEEAENLSCFGGGWVNDPGREDTKTGVDPREHKDYKG